LKLLTAILMFLIMATSMLCYLDFDFSLIASKIESGKVMEEPGRVNLAFKRISLHDVKWNGDHEIWLQGKLYDLEDVVISNDTLSCFVYEDEKEEMAYSDIFQHFDQGGGIYPFSAVNAHHSLHGIRGIDPYTDRIPEGWSDLKMGFPRSFPPASQAWEDGFQTKFFPPPKPAMPSFDPAATASGT
jgi:hypothetical protein